MSYSIGSLFDGSGGFPLAGTLCGIEPRWASEVEPYPIAVTRARFPNMKHLGDISKINGAEIEPVDVITFGSPCQDLSVAGKQAGMKHQSNGDSETTRSGLFMEAVRIIKEMRRATNGNYPKFAIWENVPGAFSSNKGEDFRTVLEEMVKICEPTSPSVPTPETGKWPYADCIMGDGWSIAYRTFDAQYWGVPQRRRRIYLVADFRGERAGKVLFEREGLRGYFTEGRTPWQGTPSEITGSSGTTNQEGKGIIAIDMQGGKGRAGYAVDIVPTMCSLGEPHAVATPTFILDNIGGQGEYGKASEKNGTLRSGCTGAVAYCLQGNGINRADTAGCGGKGWRENASYTLNTIDRPAVVYALDRAAFNQGKNAQYGFEISDKGITSPLVAKGPSAICQPIPEEVSQFIKDNNRAAPHQQDNLQNPDKVAFTLTTGGSDHTKTVIYTGNHYIVRRLTPTECARLQGFADRWGYIEPKETLTDEEYRFWLEVRNTHATINGKAVKDYTVKQMLTWYNKLHSDSAEYKMWGNGIALPPSLYCMQGIADALNESVA